MHSYELKTSDRGIASVILNRPGQHNAFDDGMIVELLELLGLIEWVIDQPRKLLESIVNMEPYELAEHLRIHLVASVWIHGIGVI